MIFFFIVNENVLVWAIIKQIRNKCITTCHDNVDTIYDRCYLCLYLDRKRDDVLFKNQCL